MDICPKDSDSDSDSDNDSDNDSNSDSDSDSDLDVERFAEQMIGQVFKDLDENQDGLLDDRESTNLINDMLLKVNPGYVENYAQTLQYEGILNGMSRGKGELSFGGLKDFVDDVAGWK